MISVLSGVSGLLLVGYFSLIATVMSYAALQVEFGQSVRGDEAAVATLESTYLAEVAALNQIDYTAEGYIKPVVLTFVTGTPKAAINLR